MKIEKNEKDLMTPIERKKAIQNGERADRVMAMPFTSEFKCYLSGISVRDFWFDVKKMAQAERIVFNIKYNSLCLCHFFYIEPKITNTDSTQIALKLAGKWHRHHSVCPLTILNCLLSFNWCHQIFLILLNFHTFSPSAFIFS